MRLDKFDLNLLVALDALLEERSVTRAAERLGLTQSGVSAALSRLRTALGDDLLEQHGKHMLLTPHAQALRPDVTRTIADLRALIGRSSKFDPVTSNRRFRLAASDYSATVLLAPLIDRLAKLAPEIRLEITLPNFNTTTEMVNGNIDLVLLPSQFVHSDHPNEYLLTERYVVVAWSENPLLKQSITEDDFLSARHVAVAISDQETFIDAALREQRKERRIDIAAPSFLQLPFLLIGTRRIGVIQERLAIRLAKGMPFRICDLPFDIPAMEHRLQYHEARGADPGLAWLRDQLKSVAAEI